MSHIHLKIIEKRKTSRALQKCRNRFEVLNNIDNNTGSALQCIENVKCDTLPDVSENCKQSNDSIANENVGHTNAAVLFKMLIHIHR